MENYTIKRYGTETIKCISENDAFFYEQETVNSVLLSTFQNKCSKCFCSIALKRDTNEVVFALFALKDGLLYASGIANSVKIELYKDLVDFLVKDFLSALFPFTGFHSYEPALPLLQLSLAKNSSINFEMLDDVWSYNIEQIKWTPAALKIRDDPNFSFCLATMKDFDLIKIWTQGFVVDTGSEIGLVHFDVAERCREELDANNVYFLCLDGKPISMAWKRRPLRYCCAIAYVFTPLGNRGKGYGKACVSLLTEKLLQEYRQITLFVLGSRDPRNNLYSSIGYRLMGKAGRFRATT